MLCFTETRLPFQRSIPSFSFYLHPSQFLCLFYPFPHKLNPPSSHNLACWFSNVILIFLWLFFPISLWYSWFTHPSYPIFYSPSPICLFFLMEPFFDFCEIESKPETHLPLWSTGVKSIRKWTLQTSYTAWRWGYLCRYLCWGDLTHFH